MWRGGGGIYDNWYLATCLCFHYLRYVDDDIEHEIGVGSLKGVYTLSVGMELALILLCII